MKNLDWRVAQEPGASGLAQAGAPVAATSALTMASQEPRVCSSEVRRTLSAEPP